MSREFVRDTLRVIEAFYSKTLNDAQLDFYVNQLVRLDPDDLSLAVNEIMAKEARFPLLSIIQRYAMEVRQVKLNKLKENAPTFKDLERNNQTTLHGKMAIALMRDLYEKKITREQYIARMFQMEKQFPGIGWAKAANEVKKFWDDEYERHDVGRRYLERIWLLQDAAGFPSFNNPDWYIKRKKELGK